MLAAGGGVVRLFPDECDAVVPDALVELPGGVVAVVEDVDGMRARLATVAGPVGQVRDLVGDALFGLLAAGPGGASAVAQRVAAVGEASRRLSRVCVRSGVRRWWVRPLDALDGRCPVEVLGSGWLPTQEKAVQVLGLAG